ncbi:hypothetical protein CYY_002648 [Polysphondylium violaceum]|uniref:RRM domain-containing protein n=1 Tax=Polysphondylium violaceum TaxID=133409 RepID=A0A8J4V9E9_9MYCE|nr:hypothetical protein CYY_002648 [Polysphondylium violaceum]
MSLNPSSSIPTTASTTTKHNSNSNNNNSNTSISPSLSLFDNHEYPNLNEMSSKQQDISSNGSTTTTTTTTTTTSPNNNSNNNNNIDILSNKRSLEQPEDFEESIAKKQKNPIHPPSKVIHLRNLPLDCADEEVLSIVAPFGTVDNLIVLKGKGQALIQMAELSCAESFVQYYTTIQGSIRSKSLYVQFSNREEISPSVETPNDILLITISHILYYPVTIEILYKLFSSYGNVLRILIFTKGGNFQSLIQLQTSESAHLAKKNLDGLVVAGYFTLKVQFSSLTNLKIKYNNDKSRDFTNPGLPSGNHIIGQSGAAASPTMGYHHALGAGNQYIMASTSPTPPPTTLISSPHFSSVPPHLPSASPASHHHLHHHGIPLHTVVPSGSVPSLAHLQPLTQSSPPITTTTLSPVTSTTSLQKGMQQLTTTTHHHHHHHQSLHTHSIASKASAANQNSQPNSGGASGGSTNGGSVLIVAGLPTQDLTPDDLFTLFGVYGDPIRVKIMYNRKDTALIQMNTCQQAELVLQYLQTFPFKGHTVRVNISKHSSISLPKPGENNYELTKDYTGSTMHRFKLPGSKNYQHIHPPSNILHISNLPIIEDIEEKVKRVFSLHGVIKSFKFFPNDTKMALVEMGALEQAVDTLVALHGYSIGENVIKVSFAKPTIKKNIAL